MIYDSNVHLTVSDNWDNVKFNYQTEIEHKFKKILKQYKLKGAACVGIGNIEKYNHTSFINKFKNKNFFLVPALNLDDKLKSQIDLFSKYRCNAIKIHPRSFKKTLEEIDLDKIFYYCNKRNFKIFICTYFNDVPKNFYNSDPKYIFSKAYKNYRNLKILLMHGGCERLMEFAELSRFSENILLDLSLTITKYAGSSVDNDIKFLFKNFDRKITLGSDFPEVNYDYFIKRVRFFSKNLPTIKKNNIFYKNMLSFIKK